MPADTAASDAVLTVLTTVQMGILAVLTLFGVHRGWLALVAWRHSRGLLDPTRLPPDIGDEGRASSDWPSVTVQLPFYNERAVATRLLDAVAAFDYPRDKLQIQILDDSDDDTTEILRRWVHAAPPDLDVQLVRRPQRSGYKAGALDHGLEHGARGELVAIFDADFVPPSDFLRRAVPPFANPKIGMVQTRWDHLDAEFGLLTRVQAILLDGHFAVDHLARAAGGHLFNFNGTGGLFRRTTIDDAGGWSAATLTEDLELSYRAQLRGWKFAYLPGLPCPAELPVDAAAFATQQYRWAKGGTQTARLHLGTLLRGGTPQRPLRLASRVEAALHLLGNFAFPLLLLVIVLGLPIVWLQTQAAAAAPSPEGLAPGGSPFLAGALGMLVHYGYAQARLRRFSWSTPLLLPAALGVGAGLAVSNTHAVIAAFGRRTGAFVRTPKRAAVRRSLGERAWHYRSSRGWIPAVEVAMGTYAATTSTLAGVAGWWPTALFHGLFAAGLFSLGGSSLWHGLRPAPAAPTAADPDLGTQATP